MSEGRFWKLSEVREPWTTGRIGESEKQPSKRNDWKLQPWLPGDEEWPGAGNLTLQTESKWRKCQQPQSQQQTGLLSAEFHWCLQVLNPMWGAR
jgi:hypothetical protein